MYANRNTCVRQQVKARGYHPLAGVDGQTVSWHAWHQSKGVAVILACFVLHDMSGRVLIGQTHMTCLIAIAV